MGNEIGLILSVHQITLARTKQNHVFFYPVKHKIFISICVRTYEFLFKTYTTYIKCIIINENKKQKIISLCVCSSLSILFFYFSS